MKIKIVAGLLTTLVVAAAFAQADAQPSMQLSGEVQPATVTDVKPESTGRIKKLHVHMGDEVKAGDLLVEIDELISDEAYEKRAAELTPKNALPAVDRETQRKKDVLALTKVCAPRGGTVLTVPVIEDQVVAPKTNDEYGTTLMTIGDLSKLIVQSHVPQPNAAKLAIKQGVQVTAASAPGEQVEAAISFIAPIATLKNSVKGFDIQAVVEKPCPWLHPGMTVQLAIPIAAQKASR